MTDLTRGVRPVTRRHFQRRAWQDEESVVVDEAPDTLFVNGREYVTVALTPIDIEDWAIGLLAGDGVISTAADVSILQWHPDVGQLWLRVPGYRQADNPTSRYLGSCCGQSRPGFFNPVGVPPLTAACPVSPADLHEGFHTLSHWSHTQHSGGLHVAALSRQGKLRAARADVGRHNAVDKVFGHALRDPLFPFADHVLLFSGRLSAEIIWKTRVMGCGVIASNAAPTSLGVSLAQQLGITLIGFLRGEEFSVYSHAERVLP